MAAIMAKNESSIQLCGTVPLPSGWKLPVQKNRNNNETVRNIILNNECAAALDEKSINSNNQLTNLCCMAAIHVKCSKRQKQQSTC